MLKPSRFSLWRLRGLFRDNLQIKAPSLIWSKIIDLKIIAKWLVLFYVLLKGSFIDWLLLDSFSQKVDEF